MLLHTTILKIFHICYVMYVLASYIVVTSLKNIEVGIRDCNLYIGMEGTCS